MSRDVDLYREATLRPRVRGERGVVGDGDGADDGQSAAVVVVDVGAVEPVMDELLAGLRLTPDRVRVRRIVDVAATGRRVGWGFRDLGTARVPSKRGLAWCAQNGK
jgi:hypothetical protein